MGSLMSRLHRNRVLAAGLLSLSMAMGCGTAEPPNSTGVGGQSSAGTGGQVTGQAGNAGAGPAGTAGQVTGQGGNAGAGSGGSNPTGVAGNAPAGTGGGAAGAAGGNPAGQGGGPAGGGGSQSAGRGGSGVAGNAGAAGGTTPAAEPTLITSAQNNYWKTGTLTEVTTGTIDVTVNDTAAQNWDGMGGTFNEVGWNVLMMLTPAERDRAMKLLFDATEGARFQNGRIPIGASDYAMSRYTLNETAGDTAMNSFSITRDNQYLIPYIKAALAIKPDVSLWASPWTPPSWMKTTNAIDGGSMKEDATTLQAFALYLAKFVEEYGKVGINIKAIHPQNEPGYETRYPSCLWTAAGMTTLIGSHLGPLFASRNITAQIYLGTMSNNDAGKDGTIVTAVNGNATAAGYVKGYGLQWNMLPVISTMNLRSRNLPIVQTEHKCGNYHWNPTGFPPFNPDMPANDYAYGVESWGYIRDWIKAGVTSYSAWNMVLDTAGKNLDTMRPWPQNALLTVNTSSKTLTVTPAYYVFRHVSQYVDPGAKVVTTSGSSEALAFKNPDGTFVAVVYNAGAARNYIVSVAGKRQQFMMPANGWATINWK